MKRSNILMPFEEFEGMDDKARTRITYILIVEQRSPPITHPPPNN
jgi:hypothetical protein